jgi:DNA primase
VIPKADQRDKDSPKFSRRIVNGGLPSRLQLDPKGGPMSLVDEIKNRVTVEDILSEQGIELRRGRCRCPLHGGDNPTSFSVRDGLFHCFACGESGDVISLVQKLYGFDFKEALRHLAHKAGISEVNDYGPVPEKREVPKRDDGRWCSEHWRKI